jgi:pyrroline-5-carboxylate reductase
MTKKIAIIGGGNLGTAIALGLIKSKFSTPSSITVTKRNPETLTQLQREGINISSNNREAAENADVVILAIKPYQIEDVLINLKPVLNPKKQLICSVVTGYSIDEIKACIGNDFSILRAMPNTAVAIGESMTCICSSNTNKEQQQLIEDLFNNLGKVVFIEEALMEAATVLGACGIAYALRFIRAKIQGGIEIGFDAKTATLIAAQTVKGAAALLIENGHHPEYEIDKVTTPKGCTIAGLNEMEHQGFSSSLIKGINTSYKKIEKK